ncbi:MAG: OadG family transporter subunit [Candidatus Kapabacteria bacterium]|nr:OadG family transporter subunit [Candidatus Kapabacteria bacterium]
MNDNVLLATQMLVIGVGGVFVALIFFAIVIAIIRDAKSWFGKKQQPAAAVSAEKSVVSVPKEDPRDIVAIISAAAEVAYGKRVKITKISFLQSHADSGWTEYSRLGTMSNHNIILKGTMR